MDKPEFDPSQPFQAVGPPAADKPAFDPSKDFSVVAEPQLSREDQGNKDIVDQTNALGRGVAQGATLGFGDELAGLGNYLGNLIAKHTSGLDDEGQKKFEQAVLSSAYKSGRDEDRAANAAAQAANPKSFMAGELGGGLLTGGLVPGGGSLPDAVASAAAQGAITGAGASTAEDAGDVALDAAKGAGIGSVAGAAGHGLAALPLGKPIANAASYIQDKLGGVGGVADKLAEAATGATGKQSAKFAPGAGLELLKRKLVGYFDTPEAIAGKVGAASDAAGQAIGDALKELDAKGVTASVDNVTQALESKISQLKADPSQAGVVRKLQGMVDDIKSTGASQVPVGAAEQTKRGFQAQSNYAKPKTTAASKNVADAYRQEVERSALAADPTLANKFTEGKDTYGLLAPIKEAAQNRAATLNQSPFGGLLDVSAITAGAAAAGAPGAIAAPIARKLISPRLASTGANAAFDISNTLAKTPEVFGKFAPVLQNAAQRGAQALAATHFILQSTNEEYRKQLDGQNGQEQQP